MEDVWQLADAGIRLVLGLELMVVPFLGFPFLGESLSLGLGSITVGLVLCGTAIHRLLRGRGRPGRNARSERTGPSRPVPLGRRPPPSTTPPGR